MKRLSLKAIILLPVWFSSTVLVLNAGLVRHPVRD